MKQLFKHFFYKTRRWLAAILCVILCIQAVEPLGATIAKLRGENQPHITLLDAPGVDPTVFERMDLYVEQRGEIFALDLEFEVAANRVVEEPTTEELSSEENTLEESTVEESTAESTTEEESVTEEPTTEEPTTEESTAEESTAEEPTTEESTAEESTAEEPTTEESTTEKSTTEVTNTEEASAAETAAKEEEPSSKDLEVEQIIHELESVYAEEPSREIQILEQTEVEELQFYISFTDAFYLLESPGDQQVLNAEGKPIGSFELLQEEEKILLTATFDVPLEREETVEGSLQFSMGNTDRAEGDMTLLWDVDEEAVDVEIEETWIGGLLDRFALRNMQEYAPKAEEVIPETSKSFEFDLMTQLPSDITRKYDKLKLVMSVPRAAGSDTVNTEISMRIDAAMKNSYLANELGSVEDEILSWLDESADNANKGIMGWLDSTNAKDVPALEFSIEFADSADNPDTVGQNEELSFGVLPGATVSDITINNDKYGTCTLERDSTGEKVILTCELSKKLYGMKNVTFGANFSLNAEKELQEKEVPDFQMNGGKIECSGSSLYFLDSEPSNTKPYTLVKTIEGYESNSSDTPYVTFKVEVDSYENLAGITIVDELPAELQLSSLRLKCDKEPEKILKIDEDYTENNKVISYTFPHDSTVSKAILYVDAVLTPEKVFAMTNGSNEADQTAKFTNKAYLKDKAGQKITDTEDNASGEKRFQMFQKSGKQNKEDGSLLDWTIDIDVSFKGSKDVYLVDSLNPTSHDYLDGGTLTVEIGEMENGTFRKENTQNLTIQKKTTNEPNRDYASVTADSLNTITDEDKTKAYVYTSSTDEHVLALNLENYIGSNGKHVRVLYSTKMIGLDNQAGTDGKKTFHNYADLRWKALYWGGKGPAGDTANLQYTINKPVEAAVNMAVKRAGAYDEKTQLQTWYFDINHYGMAYSDLVITEDFTNITDQKIPDDGGSEWLCSISQVHKGSGFAEGTIPNTAGTGKPYYTKNGQEVEIHLGDVAPEDYFTVAFQTKVGGSALTGNTTEYELRNEAKISTNNLGTVLEKATSDIKGIPNTLLEKEALKPDGALSDGKVNGYDSKTGELHWRISINPNSLHIKEGVITDTLPVAATVPAESNQFGRITKVTYGSGNDTKSTVNNDVNAYTGDNSKDLIQIGDSGIYIKIDKTSDTKKTKFSIVDSAGITAKDIEKPLTIEFTTKLNDTVAAALFEDDRAKKPETQGIFVETYKNVTCLDGKIVDSIDSTEVAIDPAKAKDEASHHISIRGMNKGGTYGGKGIIVWDAVINESHSSIGGLTLKDQLSEQIEYRKDSLKLFEITGFDSDGTSVSKSEIANSNLVSTYGFKETKDSEKNTIGFELTFPTNDTNAYYISFATFIVEDAIPNDIKNTLVLSGGTKGDFSSNVANGGSGDKFYVDDYATGTSVPLLLLEKVSSSKDEYGKYQIKFENVDFQISQIKRNAGNSGWEGIQPVKTKVTNEKGRKLFFDVEKGSIFRIVEVVDTVPQGYTKMTDKFVYFKTDEDKSTHKTDNALISYIRTSSDVPSGTLDDDIYLVDSLYKRLILENTPDGASNAGKIKVVKQNEKGGPIEGVTYQLKHSKGWVKTQVATSDANGIITFEQVDPSEGDEYYTLTELSSVEPYSVDKTAYKVEVDGNGTYTIKNGNAELTKTAVSGEDLYQIENKLAAANLQITKQDSITKKVLEGATYTLTGTDYLGRDVNTIIETAPFTSDSSGQVNINHIPVNKAGESYTLTESVYPQGYQQSSDKTISYKVTVTSKEQIVNADKVYKDYKAEVKMEKSADAPDLAAFTPVNAEGTAKAILTNVPVVGKITFTKNGDIRGTKSPLGGVTFGLYMDSACTKPAKDSNGNDLITTSAINGDIGKVTFDKVYYGKYYIKERYTPDRPKGYVMSEEAAEVTVEPGDITETLVGTQKTYSFTKAVSTSGEEKLTNGIANTNIRIKKTNQNGELLPGVTFRIERYGDAGTAEPVGSIWVKYEVPNVGSGTNEVVADALGMVDFGNVIYGTYRLTETAIPPEYALIVNQKPFYIKVGLTSDATTGKQTVKVVKYETEPVNKSPEDISLGEILTENASRPITIPVINELKYGLIQLNKVAATKEVIGVDTTYTIASKEGKASTIGGATFEIYQASAVTGTSPSLKPGAKPYVTLKTNANGQFDYITAAGEDQYSYEDALTGKKVKLLLGTYYIRETEAPEGYLVDKTLYPFELTEEDYKDIEKTDDSRYQWIQNTKTATVILNGIKDTTHSYFVNEIVRATVTLDKVKKDKGAITKTAKLKGASFIIYTEETTPKAVAGLKWDEASQKYLLSNENPLPTQGKFVTENAQGIPYVVKHDVTGIYELVAGKYFVDEAVTPLGYLNEKDESGDGFAGRKKYRFVMDSATPKVISNESIQNNDVFTNTLGRGTLKVKKEIDTNGATQAVVTEEQKDPDGFQFTLTKKSTESGLDYTQTTQTVSGGTSSVQGTVTFTDIPYGEYTLTETKGTKEGYQLMESLELKITGEGVVITSDLTNRTDVTYNDNDKILEVKNTLVHADITGIKVGDTGIDYGQTKSKLAGAVFALYRDNMCSDEICTAASTEVNGTFTFENIPYGQYWVKEKTAPQGYEISTEVVEVNINADGDPVVIEQDKFINVMKKSRLELVKTDATTGNPVSGAVFRIYGKEDPIKDQVVAYLVESPITSGTYVLSNQGEGNTVNSSYLLYNTNDSSYYLTGGEYYYLETTTPKYYQKNPANVDFTIIGTDAGDLKTLAPITNTRELTNVGFAKVDEKNGSRDSAGNFVPYGIAGITFTLYSDAACTDVQQVQQAKSSGDAVEDRDTGTVLFTDLLPGTYYLKETAVPQLNTKPMYIIKDTIYTFTVDQDVSDGVETPKIVLLSGSSDAVSQIENEANPDLEVKLTMDLKSTTGEVLPNARFRLFRNGVFYATVWTGPDGRVDFGKVLPAIYTLVQDTSPNDHRPIVAPIISKVEDPEVTGITQYHIPVINEIEKSQGSSGSSGQNSGSSKPKPEKETDEEQKQLPIPDLQSPPSRIVPDVIPSDMVLEKDVEDIQNFFQSLEDGILTTEDLVRKERWGKEFQKNSKIWQEKFGMTKEEWEFFMTTNFGANYINLPKTGGLMGTIFAVLIGLGLVGYGAYETFGRRKKKWFKQKKMK